MLLIDHNSALCIDSLAKSFLILHYLSVKHNKINVLIRYNIKNNQSSVNITGCFIPSFFSPLIH